MSGYNGQYIDNIGNIEYHRRQKTYPVENVFMQSILTPNLEFFADDNHVFFDDEDY